jgi:hypothetical protein
MVGMHLFVLRAADDGRGPILHTDRIPAAIPSPVARGLCVLTTPPGDHVWSPSYLVGLLDLPLS